MTKLVIFDCDGTLVDSQNGIVAAMDYAFRALDLPPPTRAQTLAVVGLSLPEAFSIIAAEHDRATRIRLAERYRNAFFELKREPAHHEPLFDDAGEVIQALGRRTDLLLGIATGKSRRGVDRLFDREGWHQFFTTVQTADDHPSKPHPSMILRAMEEAGAEPCDTVMVGDTTFDMEMAAAAGVSSIGVAWGYHRVVELVESGATSIVDRYLELPAAIDMLWSEQRALG
jgi:phosphoglycolate phosphatase